MDNAPIAAQVATVTQLFTPLVFILNSNYRAFQLDQVKQSGRDSYINRRSNRSFIRVGKTGSLWRAESLEIWTAMNKQAKDAFTVYRYGVIEDKIEITESRRVHV